MSIKKILSLDGIHKEIDTLLKCDFREIQKTFAQIKERYIDMPIISKNNTPTSKVKILSSTTSKNNTPTSKEKILSSTPSTYYSTPKLPPKRKLHFTPQKKISSSKSSRKNSDNQNIDPEKIFGRPLKVNLKDIFQGYISSSDDSSKGSL